MKQYFEIYKGTPPLSVKGDYRCSVHYSDYRLKKAKEQIEHPNSSVDEIIKLTNNFLQNIGISRISEPRFYFCNCNDINYDAIKDKNKLSDERDIVWMKFTSDGYLGVVATSNDINFDIPLNSSVYDEKISMYNKYKKCYERKWKYNTSGILVHQIDKTWDTSFVLIFPLKDMPKEYKRGDIERAIGNYLISKGVPIIDFYSHNY